MTPLLTTSPIIAPQMGALVRFTGLVFLSPGPGQGLAGECGCGGKGRCLAIAVENGVVQGACLAIPGRCPGEYPKDFSPQLAPTEEGSYYGVGLRVGRPIDLLANLENDGCCSGGEVEVPDLLQGIELAELLQGIRPQGSLKGELRASRKNAEELRKEVEGLRARVAVLEKEKTDAENYQRQRSLGAHRVFRPLPKLKQSECDALQEAGSGQEAKGGIGTIDRSRLVPKPLPKLEDCESEEEVGPDGTCGTQVMVGGDIWELPT